MIQMILLAGLVLIATITLLVAIISSIVFLIQKLRGRLAKKSLRTLKRAGVTMGVMVITMGGLILFSRLVAHTPQILNDQGKPLDGSIAELTQVTLNGRKEWISIRGKNTEKPVLLFLAGGPGGTQMAAVRHDLSELEKYFVVVNWDQPGSGKSYTVAPKGMTPEVYVEDGLALTSYLQERFGQEKIYMLGESWGSALAIFLAEKKPEAYHAVIGTGQMVDFLETELMDYDKAMAIAIERGDSEKIAKLTANGKPPYYGSDVTWKSAEYLNYLSSYMNQNPEITNNGYETFRDIFSEEYSLVDKINYFRGILNTFNHVYPQLYDIDLRTDYNKIEVPVYFLLGRHDVNAPTSLVEDYMLNLDAPHKEIIWFEHSGHSPWINESERFVKEVVIISEKSSS